MSQPDVIELDGEALEAARLAVEDELIDRRDRGILIIAGNGLTVNWRDGRHCDIRRMSTRDGLATGIRAYLAALTGSTGAR